MSTEKRRVIAIIGLGLGLTVFCAADPDKVASKALKMILLCITGNREYVPQLLFGNLS